MIYNELHLSVFCQSNVYQFRLGFFVVCFRKTPEFFGKRQTKIPFDVRWLGSTVAALLNFKKSLPAYIFLLQKYAKHPDDKFAQQAETLLYEVQDYFFIQGLNMLLDLFGEIKKELAIPFQDADLNWTLSLSMKQLKFL